MGNCRSKDAADTNSSIVQTANNNHQHLNQPNGSSSLTVNERISSTRGEISELLKGIEQFQGTTEEDKQYKYLDEMLTRCIIKLDDTSCSNSTERDSRKQVIKGINRAISILERKLEINSDIKKLENNLANGTAHSPQS